MNTAYIFKKKSSFREVCYCARIQQEFKIFLTESSFMSFQNLNFPESQGVLTAASTSETDLSDNFHECHSDFPYETITKLLKRTTRFRDVFLLGTETGIHVVDCASYEQKR